MHRLIAILTATTIASVCGISSAEVSDKYLVSWVEQRAEKLETRFSNRPMDQIGWAESLGRALAVAKEHNRPVFLFTLEGHMNTGRC